MIPNNCQSPVKVRYPEKTTNLIAPSAAHGQRRQARQGGGSGRRRLGFDQRPHCDGIGVASDCRPLRQRAQQQEEQNPSTCDHRHHHRYHPHHLASAAQPMRTLQHHVAGAQPGRRRTGHGTARGEDGGRRGRWRGEHHLFRSCADRPCQPHCQHPRGKPCSIDPRHGHRACHNRRRAGKRLSRKSGLARRIPAVDARSERQHRDGARLLTRAIS